MSSGRTSPTHIRRLLVANRGEIARRVFRTAHQMGIETVAVFADGDATAPFVREAQQAVALAGRSPSESYLDVDKVLAAARRTNADAIHPGYGFLAENAEFAQAVIDAGLTWVGPSPSSIASMGDKLAAKAIMADTIVPTLPSIEVTDATDVGAAAEAIGFPVLIKASAGGGGKGMRVVTSAGDIADAVASAQREAASAFGNGTVFIEKYLTAPRHIEIQVLGDQHGNIVHLFERECSIQRRHQKIIEEAPSPVLSETLRDQMGQAAVAAAAAVQYFSAGTVEFLVDGDGDDASFYFLEMNTRIQVEHPVTEEVTGVDLVREQLRIAMGEPLGFDQQSLSIQGHAIEARLYAEDPANEFLPAIGTLFAFEMPATTSARLDSGVERGSVVGVDFDPMLAKVIVHAPTRTEAASQLAMALDGMALAGVTTNRDFLVATLRTPEFLTGDTTTDFIERVQPAAVFEPDDQVIVGAARAAAMFDQVASRRAANALSFMPSGFRNSSMPPEANLFSHGGRDVDIAYRIDRSAAFDVHCHIEGEMVGEAAKVAVVACDVTGGEITLDVDGVQSKFVVTLMPAGVAVQGVHGTVNLGRRSRFPDYSSTEVAGGQTAPMPGKVMSVHVDVGDAVIAGQALVIMEAMKMEHTIVAPGDGVVAELRCAVGDQVDNGQVLVVLDSGAGEEPE